MNARTKLDAWVEWRERCALGLCHDETKAVLQAWAKALAFRLWSGTLTDQIELGLASLRDAIHPDCDSGQEYAESDDVCSGGSSPERYGAPWSA